MSGAFNPVDAPLWNAGDAVRFTDAEGIAWRVVERSAVHVPGSHGPWCLIFLSEGLVRRVWSYPPGWRTLAPTALESLTLRP
jgi:hypothetical protein